MNRKNLLLSFVSLLIITGLSFVSGCGSDDSTTPTTSGGWSPEFSFKPGQTFIYANDSIANVLGVQTTIHTTKKSTDVVQLQTSVGGQMCYPFVGSTRDTAPGGTYLLPDAYNVYYSGGKYYQYGIRKLIDTSQALTWDLVGDFTVARGTSYTIGTINYSISLPPFGVANFTGPLTGKIADSTTISTVHYNEIIHCYKIELNAKLSATVSGIPITGDVFIDYYLGYSSADFPTNPTGMVRLNLHPFAFNVSGTPQLYEPGYDRILREHANP